MVNKSLLLIKSNLKKSIKQIIALILLVILSACIFNVFLTISYDYPKNFDVQCEKLDSSDYNLNFLNFTNLDGKSAIEEVASKNEKVKDYEIIPIYDGHGTIDFGEDSELTNVLFFESYTTATSRKYDKYEILEESNEKYEDGVYLSYLFKVSAHYKVGDEVNVTISNHNYSFHIQGFYNSIVTGTINCGGIAIIISDACFEQYKSDQNLSYILSINTGGEKIDTISSELSSGISSKAPFLTLAYAYRTRALSGSRYTTATLFKAILIVASVIMMIVLAALIAIILSNYIKNNISNFGILKSIGYSSKSLIIPLIIEFVIIALISSIVGVLLSYTILPTINGALEAQIGIPYNLRFIFWEFILDIAVFSVLTLVVSYFSIRKIRNIYPINAIRESGKTNKKRGNFINLEKTKMPLNMALGLNTGFSGVVRNIIISLTFISISFLLGFSCFTYQNIIKDQDYAINLVCGQTCDSVVSTYNFGDAELKNYLNNKPEVEDYYLYSTHTILFKDAGIVNAYVIEPNNPYLSEENICVEGRFPISSNEITINKDIALNHKLKLYDKISADKDGQLVEYTIVGLSQGAYYCGVDCYMTLDAYERFTPIPYKTYFVDLKEGADISKFNAEISNKSYIFFVINEQKYFDSVAVSYSNILQILCYIIAILSVLIAAFVLYVLFSLLLENKQREHGILKSLGFVSKDIIFQMEISIVPISIISIVIGLLLSRRGSSALLVLILKSIGIFEFGTKTSLLVLLIAGLALILFTIIYIIFLSRPVKKISPHKLFNRE